MGSPAGGGYGAPQGGMGGGMGGGWGGGMGGGMGGGWGGYGKPAPKVGYGGQMQNMPMMETGMWRGPMGRQADAGFGGFDPRSGAMTGGNMGGVMGGPLESYGGWGGPGGALTKMGGGIQQPLGAQTGGNMGGADFVRREADMSMRGQTGGNMAPAVQPPMGGGIQQPPVDAAPMSRPAPAAPPAFDYGQVFGNLYGQNPAAAYKFVDGTDPAAGDWFQKNQMQIRDSRFGGNQDSMNQWINNSFYNDDRSLRGLVDNTVAGYRR